MVEARQVTYHWRNGGPITLMTARYKMGGGYSIFARCLIDHRILGVQVKGLSLKITFISLTKNYWSGEVFFLYTL